MKGKHPNSKANLKPLKKGVSGNPTGRAISFTGSKEELKILADEEHSDNILDDIFPPPLTRKELVHRAIWKRAEKGDTWAIELLERLGCLD